MRPHAEASPTAHRRERTRHRAAPRTASSVRLLPLVSHRDRRLFDAIPRLCSSRPRTPWMVSLYRHPHRSRQGRLTSPPASAIRGHRYYLRDPLSND
jgi:hypothetical protein